MTTSSSIFSCFDCAEKLKNLGIPARYSTWRTENNHLTRGRIHHSGATFSVICSPVSWSLSLSDPPSNKPQLMPIELKIILGKVVDMKTFKLKVSLEEAQNFFTERAKLNYWGCQVGDIVRFVNKKAFNCANWQCDFTAKIIDLQHGTNEHFAKYHAVLLHNNQKICWSKGESCDMQFVVNPN